MTCQSQNDGAVRDRRLDQVVLVRPAPLRRRDLAVEHLDGQPLGHALTLGRSRPAVHGPPHRFPALRQTRMGAVNEQQPVQLRVGLAQIDTRVGDLDGQRRPGPRWTAKAAGGGAHLVVFPEMTLTGYPPEDLVLRESFAQASERALVDLAAELDRAGARARSPSSSATSRTPRATVPRPVDQTPTDADDRPSDANPRRGAPRNAAALLHGGEVVVRYYKRHLPNYGVFDEARYFVPGTELPVVRLHGVDVALTICEDLWVEGGPCGVAGQAGVDLVVSPNASPYERAKDDARLPLVRRRAAEAHATDPVLQPGGRPGRAGLRRRLDGGRRRRRAAGPRAAVRRAPAVPSTSTLRPRSRSPSARDGRIGPMTVTRHVRLGGAGARVRGAARHRRRAAVGLRGGLARAGARAARTSSTRTACPR